jgi:molecular chaperone GrpE
MTQPDGAEVSLELTPEARLVELAAERDRLAAEKADLQDRLLRQIAEFDNFRRRTERDRVEFYQNAAASVVRDLLPVLDDFERALQVKTADENYAKGVNLIYNRFFETLKKLGLEPVESLGRPFDPNLHEAIGRVESADAEDGTVIGEMQKGYNFKGKLLRPSWVQVAVKR